MNTARTYVTWRRTCFSPHLCLSDALCLEMALSKRDNSTLFEFEAYIPVYNVSDRLSFGGCNKYGVAPKPLSLILISAFVFQVVAHFDSCCKRAVKIHIDDDDAEDDLAPDGKPKQRINIITALWWMYQILTLNGEVVIIFVVFDYSDDSWQNYKELAYLLNNSAAC
jgi:hypothetical protein